MKFVRTIYILIVVFAEKGEKFVVRCVGNFKEAELLYLSQKLNILECLQLVQNVYEMTPMRISQAEKRIYTLDEDFSHLPTTSKTCLVNLEQWNNDFPRIAKPGGRSTMEMTLRWLGRPDLAKYVRENRGSIKFQDVENNDTLEFPEHNVLKRHVSNNNKSSSTKGKKKKKKARRGERSKSSDVRNKGSHRGFAAAVGHVATRKGHPLKKKENQSQKRKDYLEQHRSLCCSIMFVILFVTLCLVAVYFLRKHYHATTRGTRFKYKWNTGKEDKDTLTDDIQWNDEENCSCSDVEAGCTGKCSMCSRNYDTRDVEYHQNASDDTDKNFNSVATQKTKKRKPKKKSRFSFLQSYQDKKKEKDKENQDRKCVKGRNAVCFPKSRKILEQRVLMKKEKVANIFQGDHPQCACCKCNWSSKEKMIRERRENEKKLLHKLRKKKRKLEKRRKKDEIEKAQKYPNVCFKDTCK